MHVWCESFKCIPADAVDASDMDTSALLLVHTCRQRVPRITYWIAPVGMNTCGWTEDEDGEGEAGSPFCSRLSAPCSVIGVLLLCLIDNMLDGKLWLFSSWRKEEGEISTLVLSLLHTLPSASAELSVSHSMEKLCGLTFWRCHNILDTVFARVCACCI